MNKIRDFLLQAAGVAVLVLLEVQLRIRGAWRRREWRTLGRYALRLVAVAAIATVAVAACAGCTVVPAATAHRACELIEIAATEADLAPAWYLDAGAVLERCGQPNARAAGEMRACFAEARNGYRTSAECEAMP